MTELPPGTRIPSLAEVGYKLDMTITQGEHRHSYYRGLAEGCAVGTALGLLLGACLTALAWSHLGG